MRGNAQLDKMFQNEKIAALLCEPNMYTGAWDRERPTVRPMVTVIISLRIWVGLIGAVIPPASERPD